MASGWNRTPDTLVGGERTLKFYNYCLVLVLTVRVYIIVYN